MKRHWWMAGLTVLVMLLGLPMGATQAQAPVPGGGLEAGDAQAIITGGSLTYSFTYQGYLERDGGPANGNFDFIITIWDTGAAGMGTQIATCSDPSCILSIIRGRAGLPAELAGNAKTGTLCHLC